MSLAFPDSNVLVYAFTADAKRGVAQAVLHRGGLISVQSLNEFANVARRKLKRSWDEVGVALSVVRSHFPRIAPLDLATHLTGLDIGHRYQLSVYDSMIIASALRGGCDTLWSEDMHHGLVIDGRLRIVNPFA